MDNITSLEERITSTPISIPLIPFKTVLTPREMAVYSRVSALKRGFSNLKDKAKEKVFQYAISARYFTGEVDSAITDLVVSHLAPSLREDRKKARKVMKQKLISLGYNPSKATALSKIASVPNDGRYKTHAKTGLIAFNIGGIWKDDFYAAIEAVDGQKDYALLWNAGARVINTLPSAAQAIPIAYGMGYVLQTGLKHVGVNVEGLPEAMASTWLSARLFENILCLYKTSKGEYVGSPTSAFSVGIVPGILLKSFDLKQRLNEKYGDSKFIADTKKDIATLYKNTLGQISKG